MPQALVLMNSELFESILRPHTQLRVSLSKAATSDEQVETVYRTLLARSPTPREKAAWQASGLQEIEDLIFALLNSQQFIFVQ